MHCVNVLSCFAEPSWMPVFTEIGRRVTRHVVGTNRPTGRIGVATGDLRTWTHRHGRIVQVSWVDGPTRSSVGRSPGHESGAHRRLGCTVMILISLTGGIGSGKSTVARGLADRGAVLLDADAMVRDMQQPGQPVFVAMVERWGTDILTATGELDRAAVAGIVFNDNDELEMLESMIHPEVRAEMRRRIDELAGTDAVIVQDVPLLEKVMGERRGESSIVVVDCPVEVAIERLVEFRGFERADAKARVAAQISRSERVSMADFVIDNSGGLDRLAVEIERCWTWIQALPPSDWTPSSP